MRRVEGDGRGDGPGDGPGDGTGGVPVGDVDAASAVARYIEVRSRMPEARCPDASLRAAHLGELADEFDAFVLDGFGVLNVGFEPVAGAAGRVRALKAAGRTVRVLTNGATLARAASAGKYRDWGIDIDPDEVVSSRDALARAMRERDDALRWGFVARPESDIGAMSPGAVLLEDDPGVYAAVDGFVLLGTGLWGDARQALLADALARRGRPVLVGNPDLVAPFATGFSREPGLFAHALADAGLAAPEFYGKPYGNAFEELARTLPAGLDPARIAMVGDTLHTDILGGAAAGWRTVLVTGLGLMRDLDVEAAIEASGIRPDFIVGTT